MSTGPFCTSVLYMLQQPPQRCKLLAIGCDETLEIYFVDDDENEYVEDAAGLKKRTRGGPGDLQVAARTLVFIWARGMSLRGEQRASSAARMLVYDCGV